MLDYLNEGVIDGLLNECIRHYFFPSKAKEAKKQKNIMPDLSLGTVMPFTIPVELPGGVLPYMGYIGMCRCEGYGFQAVCSGIGYINQSVWL